VKALVWRRLDGALATPIARRSARMRRI